MRLLSLNRKQKTVRNLLLSLAALLLLYTMLGCPPYTVGGMLRRVQRDYLLPEMEAIHVERTEYQDGNDLFKTRYTFVIAKAGEEYVSFAYRTHLLHSEQFIRGVSIQKDALCTAKGGTLYVAAEKLAEADSAAAAVETSPGQYTAAAQRPEGGLYTLEGMRAAEELFSFSYERTGLTTAVSTWYHPDAVPVTVTLYDASGGVLDTLSLEISTYELTSMR